MCVCEKYTRSCRLTVRTYLPDDRRSTFSRVTHVTTLVISCHCLKTTRITRVNCEATRSFSIIAATPVGCRRFEESVLSIDGIRAQRERHVCFPPIRALYFTSRRFDRFTFEGNYRLKGVR